MTILIKVAAAVVASSVFAAGAVAQPAEETREQPSSPPVAKENPPPTDAAGGLSNGSPIYGVTIPAGYRDWKVISVSQIHGKANQLRVQLGNDVAIKAYQEGKLPFPDGSIIAALHWNSESPEDNNKILGAEGIQSFIAGSPANVQFMVKDSKKYATTAGWGFADFTNRKPGDEALHRTCFACHVPARAQDYVYTHYVRTP